MYNRDFITQFYKTHIDLSRAVEQGRELRALCPGHAEENASFSVNMDTGQFSCFKPGCPLFGGGGILKFKAIVDKIPVAEAKAILDAEFKAANPQATLKSNRGRTVKDFPFKQANLDAWTDELMNNSVRLQWLKDNCLWTEETIQERNIGWDGSRYTIPIKEHNTLVNIRRYLPTGDPKVISIAEFGSARIFPIENTEYDEIILAEGEKDCILANQMGFNAITVTGGAGTFNSAWKRYFEGKKVVICYDIDAAGRAGAEKIIMNLNDTARSLKDVLLPLTTPDNADLTDYFLTGATPQDFRALIDATPNQKPRTHSVVNIPDEVYSASLSKIDEKLFYKRCKTRVRIVGKDTSPFIVPQKIIVKCNMDNNNACQNCGVGDAKGTAVVNLNETTPHILEIIDCSSSDKNKILHDILNIPTCRKFIHTEEGHQPVIRVSVIPSIDDMNYEENVSLDIKYVEREMYFIGQDLDANVDYDIEAIAVPSSQDQSLVHLGYKVEHADSSIKNFRMTPEIKKRLSVFQCKESKTN